MNILSKASEMLNSTNKERFLIIVGHRLGIAERGVLAEVGRAEFNKARACNEMTIAIWAQLWAMKGGSVPGYPDSDFISILLEKAKIGGVREELRFALESGIQLSDGLNVD